MNSQNHNLLLTERFGKLNSLQKKRLSGAFSKAPLMLKLIGFLDRQKSADFSTHSCIHSIYGKELKDPDYKTIENRFFKLRKKLLDSLEEYKTAGGVEENLLDEEMELRACIGLLNKGQKTLAYKRLEDLEKKCWKKNIFELLPRIIDRLIFCNQSFNRIEDNKAIYKRYDLAVQLNTCILQTLKKVRQVYEINYLKGITAAKSELRFVKKMADKYHQYPRFEFIYHHLSLYYKLGSRDYLNKMQVLGKHHAAVKKIYQAEGNMTIFYTPNYEYFQEVHLKQISMFYHYNRLEFEEAYRESLELKKFLSDNNAPKAETFFYNAFRAELASNHFQEAKETLDEYMEVLRKNNQSDRFPFVHTLMLMLYVYAWPKLKLDNVSYSTKMLGQYITWAEKNENLIFSFEEALIVKAGLYHTEGKYEEACEVSKAKKLENYFENRNLYELYRSFNAYFSRREKNREETEQLKSRINQLKYKVVSANSVQLLKVMGDWLK